MKVQEIIKSFTTRKGTEVKLLKEEDGYSLKWSELDSNCLDVGMTIPTEYKFPSQKYRKRFKRIPDKEILFKTYDKIKRRSFWKGLNFNEVSSTVGNFFEELLQEEPYKYYETKYID